MKGKQPPGARGAPGENVGFFFVEYIIFLSESKGNAPSARCAPAERTGGRQRRRAEIHSPTAGPKVWGPNNSYLFPARMIDENHSWKQFVGNNHVFILELSDNRNTLFRNTMYSSIFLSHRKGHMFISLLFPSKSAPGTPCSMERRGGPRRQRLRSHIKGSVNMDRRGGSRFPELWNNAFP